ncbi:hypothetical protein RB195_023250 [Necator americanus]|uniref:Uncharacterized protein n=1 Tax=Necator americanus TaxID=51031 RepID=A0ABR1EIE2_NECAM
MAKDDGFVPDPCKLVHCLCGRRCCWFVSILDVTRRPAGVEGLSPMNVSSTYGVFLLMCELNLVLYSVYKLLSLARVPHYWQWAPGADVVVESSVSLRCSQCSIDVVHVKLAYK